MLNNMKIGPRLAFGFGTILLLMIIVGVFSLYQIRQFNAALDLMLHDRFPKTVQANEIIGDINVIARALRNMVIDTSKDTTEAELKRVVEARKNAAENLEKLKATIKEFRGRTNIKYFRIYIPVYHCMITC